MQGTRKAGHVCSMDVVSPAERPVHSSFCFFFVVRVLPGGAQSAPGAAVQAPPGSPPARSVRQGVYSIVSLFVHLEAARMVKIHRLESLFRRLEEGMHLLRTFFRASTQRGRACRDRSFTMSDWMPGWTQLAVPHAVPHGGRGEEAVGG